MTLVKICGIKDAKTLKTTCNAGADFIGFVFVHNSPRYIDPREAYDLTRLTPTGTKNVGLFVNPSDEDLQNALSQTMLDYVQLHGDETPQRVKEIHSQTHMPIIKAIGIDKKEDVQQARHYEDIVDYILFDHKPVNGQAGGTGHSFDWTILENVNLKKPWMLSGGLDQNNVKQAIMTLRPNAVDVSSGVESQRGVKDDEKIINFIKEAKSNG